MLNRCNIYPLKTKLFLFTVYSLVSSLIYTYFQVSLDSRVREIINKNMMSPTQECDNKNGSFNKHLVKFIFLIELNTHSMENF
jgi:hypothetical protein